MTGRANRAGVCRPGCAAVASLTLILAALLRPTLLAALLGGVAAGTGSFAWAAPAPRSQTVVLEPEWLERLNRFLIDPVRQRDELIAVARKGTDDLPPEALVPIGDAYLRSGDLGTAESYFERALAGNVIQPWESAALLGLGITNVARGDVDGGVLWLQRAAAGGGALGDGALLTLGQIETGRGNYESAVDLYHEVLLHGDASPEMAQAAHVGTATAYFRAGDFERAAQEYRAAADRDPGSQLAQDARYGAARAQMRGGDHEGAREEFIKLSAVCSPAESAAKSSRRQRDLDPRGTLRAWIASYSRLPFQGPLVESGALWSTPVCAYTRATLERFDSEARSSFQVTPAGTTLGSLEGEAGSLDDGAASKAAESEDAPATGAPTESTPDLAPESGPSPVSVTGVAVAAVALLAIVAVVMRRRSTPPNSRGGFRR